MRCQDIGRTPQEATNENTEQHEPGYRPYAVGSGSMTTIDTSKQDRILDWGRFPGRWEITKSTEDTNGELLEMRFEIESVPEDGPFVHTHPDAEESYEVLSGVLEVYMDGEWMDVSAGEKHTVPPGTPHTFRNKTPVEIINVHRPALQHEEFFRRFHQLVADRGVTLPPGGFSDIVLIAMLTIEHEEDIRAVSPPQWAFKVLAGLGRILGYHVPD
jgi:mannose-6-phosphate isomerase-like protein (cupin superfamily)